MIQFGETGGTCVCVLVHMCADVNTYWIFLLFQKELVVQAVQKDQDGERSSALSLYCSSLEHFVPAIYCKSRNSSCVLSMLSFIQYNKLPELNVKLKRLFSFR